MKCKTARWVIFVFGMLPFLFAGLFWFLLSGGVCRGPGEGWFLDRNNPRRFHLWGSGASYRYTFTYDPREMDIWMLRSGGGSVPAAVVMQTFTNPWLARRRAQ